MARKKVVIVIVEGVSDVIALEGSLRNIYKREEVRFKIINSDITSDIRSKSYNIQAKIMKLIKAEMMKLSLGTKDIVEIIHLVDMDGVYISKDAIHESHEHKGFRYNETEIITSDKHETIKRNERKSQNLDILSSIYKISNSLYYSIYYFSCNLEHVLYNRLDVHNNKKVNLAERFSEIYEDDFEGFKKFISDKEFAVEGSYPETWDFIKKDNNSLKRFSNFHLLLKKEGKFI